MDRSFSDNEINILWDMFIKDYPCASRSTKSQVVKKWKTGTYHNTVNANAIVVKYFNQLELKQKEEKISDWADQVYKDIDEAHRELGKAQANILSREETLKRNERNHAKTKESNEEMREIIRKISLELRNEKGEFAYDSWIDSNFTRSNKSHFGL